MTRADWKVGAEAYAPGQSNAFTWTVTKVGRKWVTLNVTSPWADAGDALVDIATGEGKFGGYAFPSVEHYEEHKRAEAARVARQERVVYLAGRCQLAHIWRVQDLTDAELDKLEALFAEFGWMEKPQ